MRGAITKNRKWLVVALIVIIVTCIIVILWIPPTQNKMEKIFGRDKTELTVVCEYLLLIDCDATIVYDGTDCYVEKYKPNPSTNKLDIVKEKVENEVVRDAIEKLFSRRGYDEIYKGEHTVIFRKWHRGPDWWGGIAYKINKENQLEIGYVTEFAPLSDDGWYYYESDFNKWREMSQKACFK